MVTPDLVLAVHDADGRGRGWIRAPRAVRATARWWDTGDAVITVDGGDPHADILRQPGTRVQVRLRGRHFLGGPVVGWQGEAEGDADGTWKFTIRDDASVLERVMVWPDPTKPANQQPVGARPLSGPLESVVKTLITQNAALSGVVVDVAADLGRGPTVTLSPRLQPVAEAVGPSLRAARMAVTAVWGEDTGKTTVDVAEPGEYGITLSPRSRTVTSWRVTYQAPVADRVLVGPATGAVYQVVPDTDVQNVWGQVAAGATFRSADSPDEAATAATEALTETGPRSGVAVTLSETGVVRYGGPGGMQLGDTVTIRAGAVDIDDVVSDVTVNLEPGAGLTIQPGVGAWDSSPVRALSDAVRRVAATMRRTMHRGGVA